MKDHAGFIKQVGKCFLFFHYLEEIVQDWHYYFFISGAEFTGETFWFWTLLSGQF